MDALTVVGRGEGSLLCDASDLHDVVVLTLTLLGPKSRFGDKLLIV